MEKKTLEFQHSNRLVYACIKHLFESKRTQFSSVKFNDDLFIVEARHGAWLSPFTENVKIKVVATSSQSCRVDLESSSRSVLNLLNLGANKGNISDLGDYISNEVHKMCLPGEIPLTNQGSHSTIRFVKPDVKFRD